MSLEGVLNHVGRQLESVAEGLGQRLSSVSDNLEELVKTPDAHMGSAASAMNNGRSVCESCQKRLQFYNRKRGCVECKSLFCSACASRGAALAEGGRLCERCVVLRDADRAKLMQLKVKDIQRYLARRQVDTSACVEKRELVELVARINSNATTGLQDSNNSSNTASATASSACARSNVGPVERQRSFPKNYTESTHRHDFLAKMEGANNNDDDAEEDGFVLLDGDIRETREESPSLSPTATAASDTQAEAEASNVTETLDSESVSDRPSTPPTSNPDPNIPMAEVNESSVQRSGESRFSGLDVVYLSDLQCEEELRQLSARQIKNILALNRVNFKGVVEKEELIRILHRVWTNDRKLNKEKDALADEDLCKICMEEPIDCVMLECGHMCTCLSCGKQLAECPICRQFIVRVVKTFKA